MTTGAPQAFRAAVAHCVDDPGKTDAGGQSIDDAVLVIEGGRVAALGPAREILGTLPERCELHDWRGHIIVPGFVDAHIHYVQTDVIASYGERLLEWLETYTFPAERAFADPGHARDTARFFIDELLRNGTTTALVLGSVHAHSADAVFEAAARHDMRLVAGKVLMDRNCPEYLRDTAAEGYADSRRLIERWHGHGRLGYAVTPRFAPTSTPAQLAAAGRLAREFPDVHVHTHLAESEEEVAWVRKLYPEARSYLDVYDRAGLVRRRSLFAHAIHLDAADRERLASSGAGVVFCPTCNLFIGSGLFDLPRAFEDGVQVALGTDVGGGTTFSMLQVMHEAYKVAQLRGFALAPLRALYLATLGGARALDLDRHIGNFEVGKEADFVILNPASTPLLKRRCAVATSLLERLFALFVLGDDRAIAATYVMGRSAFAAAPRGR